MPTDKSSSGPLPLLIPKPMYMPFLMSNLWTRVSREASTTYKRVSICVKRVGLPIKSSSTILLVRDCTFLNDLSLNKSAFLILIKSVWHPDNVTPNVTIIPKTPSA